MLLSDSQRMRDADNTAINGRGIPSTWLMRNAAGHVAEAAIELASGNKSAYIFCGSGNNGGDGVAAALYLMRRGFDVRVLLCGSRRSMTADTAEMERRLLELGGRLEDFDPDEQGLEEKLKNTAVIIDALFGIGLNREIQGRALDAIALINASGAPVVSADIPSGVEADTGRILGRAVKADVTVTFSMAKTGHFAEPGCTCCGRLKIVDIGIPDDLLNVCGTNVHAMVDGEISLPRRRAVSHKGNYGRLLIIGGSVGYTGAPSLCARAAVRSGAGLVHLGVPEKIYGVTAVKNDEAMPFPLPCGGDGRLSAMAAQEALEKLSVCDVCAIGPGLGRSEDTVKLVQELILRGGKPMVIDADGLYALSRDMSVTGKGQGPLVLTPHEAEFTRMGGVLTGDRVSDARSFARKHNCVLVLKGHRTMAAFPDGEVYITSHGNPGMAKGGSGDVLTGVIAAMMGQLPLKQAVTTAVFLHSYAGDLCREEKGEYAMTAGDVIETLPLATKNILEQE